jgi:hypothetical protein
MVGAPKGIRGAASAADARQAAFDEIGRDVRGNPEALELFYKLREVMEREKAGPSSQELRRDSSTSAGACGDSGGDGVVL